MTRPAIVALLAAAAGPAALAQQHIDAVNKYAWSENVGWLNFADAGSPPGSQSVLIETSFLSGYVWGENIGWINMGDGTPTNGVSYANVNGTDFGVNLNTVTGHLTGYAWGENVGWINFSAADPPPAGAAPGAADFNGDGFVNGDDYDLFASWFEVADTQADITNDGFVNGDDYDAFASAFEAGC
mgnify:CR=1 FL=1